MSEITLDQIAGLLEKTFEEKLEPINTKLDAMAETFSSHTNTLDFLVKQTKDWNGNDGNAG